MDWLEGALSQGVGVLKSFQQDRQQSKNGELTSSPE